MITRINVTAFLQAAEKMPDVGFAQVNQSGRIVNCTKAFAQLIGWDKSDIVGKHVNDFTADEFQEFTQQRVNTMMRGNAVSCQKAYKTPTGEIVWATVNSIPVLDEPTKTATFLSAIFKLNQGATATSQAQEFQGQLKTEYEKTLSELRREIDIITRLIGPQASPINIMRDHNNASGGSTITQNQSTIFVMIMVLVGIIAVVLITLILSGTVHIRGVGGELNVNPAPAPKVQPIDE